MLRRNECCEAIDPRKRRAFDGTLAHSLKSVATGNAHKTAEELRRNREQSFATELMASHGNIWLKSRKFLQRFLFGFGEFPPLDQEQFDRVSVKTWVGVCTARSHFA